MSLMCQVNLSLKSQLTVIETIQQIPNCEQMECPAAQETASPRPSKDAPGMHTMSWLWVQMRGRGLEPIQVVAFESSQSVKVHVLDAFYDQVLSIKRVIEVSIGSWPPLAWLWLFMVWPQVGAWGWVGPIQFPPCF